MNKGEKLYKYNNFNKIENQFTHEKWIPALFYFINCYIAAVDYINTLEPKHPILGQMWQSGVEVTREKFLGFISLTIDLSLKRVRAFHCWLKVSYRGKRDKQILKF